MILWEIVAYLADGSRREMAFTALKERAGLMPKQILSAPMSLLREITRIGGAIAAEERAERLVHAAQIVENDYGGQLDSITSVRL